MHTPLSRSGTFIHAPCGPKTDILVLHFYRSPQVCNISSQHAFCTLSLSLSRLSKRVLAWPLASGGMERQSKEPDQLSGRANLNQTEPLATHSSLAFLCMRSTDGGIGHQWRRPCRACKTLAFLGPSLLLLLESVHSPHTQSKL